MKQDILLNLTTASETITVDWTKSHIRPSNSMVLGNTKLYKTYIEYIAINKGDAAAVDTIYNIYFDDLEMSNTFVSGFTGIPVASYNVKSLEEDVYYECDVRRYCGIFTDIFKTPFTIRIASLDGDADVGITDFVIKIRFKEL